MRVVVGVDVGGSGLRVQCRYADGPGPVLAGTGARVGTAGIDVAALAADARALLDGAGATGPDVVVWGMRGLLFLSDRGEVLAQVHAVLGARRTVVTSDAVTSLAGALGGLRPGAVVAAGTGAVAFGTDFGDHWNRVDGWGHVLGDRGSAAWLGLEGLSAALRARDGVPGGSAALLAAGEERFGPVDGWPRRVMTTADAPHALASFAPSVTALAATDPVAADLCARAGRVLADSLLAAAAGLTAPVLTGTGGLLGAEPVAAALGERLAEAGQVLQPALGGALDGALTIAEHVATTGTAPEHPAYLLSS
ncbi:N-acetylglucosamine kinase [Knoellia sp. p5-6-4]|uniref:N-acetylglucosamine kinase n=1 Tax=unclassified Knoellia TaxID=2618719 RepID=UPI0023DA7287|nr:BadF/BadG/BcrA/BcrD ATPase family protein [Knoellia sp. p5-6-4]MDF2144774.1 BadF/BadG/BcrA/BcrD ATPase family protein [Knoellia sp. p5-6-4]